MYAIYTRQSVDKKDSISIESQIEFCKREVPPSERIKVYKDKGYSGGTIYRPAFQQLLEDIKTGAISKVVVYRLDRMSRSLLDFASIISLFKAYNVEFISSTEKFDTSTPIGNAMLNICMVFAQLERETIQLRIKDNYYQRGKLGVFLGGGIPFGYDSIKVKIDNKNVPILIQNKKKSEVVTRIFDLYNSGKSLAYIVRLLNSEGVTTDKNARGWSSNVIARIIKSPVYVRADIDVYRFLESKGCLMVNEPKEYNSSRGIITFGESHKSDKFKDFTGFYAALGLHEGFIPADVWLQAQYRIYNNKQFANNGTSSNTWLSGLIKCRKCGYAMTYKSIRKHNKLYEYIKCSGATYKKCDMNNYFSMADLEADIFDVISRALIKKYSSKNIEVNCPNNTKEINSIKAELTSVEKKIKNLVNKMIEAEDIAMTYINSALKDLDEQKKELLDKLETLNKNNHKSEYINIRYYLDNWDDLDLDTKKQFMKTYVEYIKVDNDNIDIKLK